MTEIEFSEFPQEWRDEYNEALCDYLEAEAEAENLAAKLAEIEKSQAVGVDGAMEKFEKMREIRAEIARLVGTDGDAIIRQRREAKAAQTPQAVPVVQPEAHAATALRETPMSRAGLVKAHIHHWPTIDADLKDAARNGLSVAKAGQRSWSESKALEWARAKGKLTDQTGASSQPSIADPMAAHYGQLAGLPRQTHTL